MGGAFDGRGSRDWDSLSFCFDGSLRRKSRMRVYRSLCFNTTREIGLCLAIIMLLGTKALHSLLAHCAVLMPPSLLLADTAFATADWPCYYLPSSINKGRRKKMIKTTCIWCS
jgi:hypothetical protein